MATNKLPVFRLAGLANACTPPSIVSVCDMAVMSSMGGRGGWSAMAAVERWRRRRTSSGYLNVLVGPRYCTGVRVDGVEVVQATLMLARTTIAGRGGLQHSSGALRRAFSRDCKAPLASAASLSCGGAAS